jgi:hypothetical protein
LLGSHAEYLNEMKITINVGTLLVFLLYFPFPVMKKKKVVANHAKKYFESQRFLTVGRVRETKKFLILASALYY